MNPFDALKELKPTEWALLIFILLAIPAWFGFLAYEEHANDVARQYVIDTHSTWCPRSSFAVYQADPNASFTVLLTNQSEAARFCAMALNGTLPGS